MRPKLLSDLIKELQELLDTTGDGPIETYVYGTVPFVLFSEDDKQYYVDFSEETDETD
jgi:hypothetical protein